MDLSKIKAEAEEIEKFLSTPDAYSHPDFAAKAKRANPIDNPEIDIINTLKNDMDVTVDADHSLITLN